MMTTSRAKETITCRIVAPLLIAERPELHVGGRFLFPHDNVLYDPLPIQEHKHVFAHDIGS